MYVRIYSSDLVTIALPDDPESATKQTEHKGEKNKPEGLVRARGPPVSFLLSRGSLSCWAVCFSCFFSYRSIFSSVNIMCVRGRYFGTHSIQFSLELSRRKQNFNENITKTHRVAALPSLQLSGICSCPVPTAILTDCSHMPVGYSGALGIRPPYYWSLPRCSVSGHPWHYR